MIQVPDEFRPHQIKNYPPDNEKNFEEWFGENYDPSRNKSEREYLPIYWTSFYANNRHGTDKRAMRRLQFFLDHNLDRGKKYFTVVQWDDNILNNVSHLDLKIFGMGCKGDVQLPLVCQPHKYEFKENGRPIFASFIGAETHPIRTEMIKQLEGKDGYFISTERTSLHTYCYIMSQSKFCLSPRGYGLTSFRIQESLQYNSIPVYISDNHLDYSGFPGMRLNANDDIDACLKSWWNLIDRSNQVFIGNEMYKKYYTYEAVANMIYENI